MFLFCYLFVYSLSEYSSGTRGSLYHWTLLVYFQQDNVALQFDSLRPAVQPKKMWEVVYKYLESQKLDIEGCIFNYINEPSQSNGSDCGVYMLHHLQLLLKSPVSIYKIKVKQYFSIIIH